jgi:hypothetical protein
MKQGGTKAARSVRSRRAASVFENASKPSAMQGADKENTMENPAITVSSDSKKKRTMVDPVVEMKDTPSSKRTKVLGSQSHSLHKDMKNSVSGFESDSSSSSDVSLKTSQSGVTNSTEGDDAASLGEAARSRAANTGVQRGRGFRSALSNPAAIGVRTHLGKSLIAWFWINAVFDRRGVYHLDAAGSSQVVNHAFEDLATSLELIKTEHEIAIRSLFGRQRNRYIIQKALDVIKKELRQDVPFPDVLALLFDPSDIDGPWGVLGDFSWMEILGKIASNTPVSNAIDTTLDMIDSGRVSLEEISNKKSFRSWMRWQAIFSGILFHCHSRKHDTTQKPAEFESYVTSSMKPVADQLKAFLGRRNNGQSAAGSRCDLVNLNHHNRENFLLIIDSEPDC